MKRMIDAEKFLDKLLYMGYMDEEKSEVEEVANSMSEDAYTKDDVIAMFTELKSELKEEIRDTSHLHYDDLEWVEACNAGIENCIETIQEKIDGLRGKENGNPNM